MITTEELKIIVDLANSVPPEYSQKCFELILNHTLLIMQPDSSKIKKPEKEGELEGDPKKITPFVLPIDVRAFLSQYGLNEEIIWRFFLKEGNEIRPTYQIKATKKATAQIHHALMLCLQNAILSGQFQIEYEALRSRCTDQKCYDPSNFTKNIQNNQKFFKSISADQLLVLSPEGKSELAELLEQL
jgi:hypothetical protein